MAQFLEALMVICFGLSWPVSISKSFRSKTTAGKSIYFIILIFIGYGIGILSKLSAGTITYVFVFYVINMILVFIDICLYFRNSTIDRERLTTGGIV